MTTKAQNLQIARDEFRAACNRVDIAQAKFDSLLSKQAAAAPDSSFEAVGRAACDLFFCKMERDECQAYLISLQR